LGYEEIIRELGKTTYYTNKEISERVGCSERSVRRYIGRWADRTKGKIKGDDASAGSTTATPARILLLDIETSPMEVLTWGIFKPFITHENVLKDWSILSWSAKWLFEAEIYSQVVAPKEAVNRQDSSIMPAMWDLLNEANIVIAHNGVRFDIRRINARFAVNGMLPPMPYRMIDTMQVARRNFEVASSSLDYLNKLFGLSGKDKQEYSLWKRCVKGDDDALQAMKRYNETDVRILEELYLKLRPWIKGHPNVALYMDTTETACTNCGNTKLHWHGYYYTPAGKYRAFRCETCGGIGRSRTSELSTEEKRALNLSVAT
jgi:hypothetical protein